MKVIYVGPHRSVEVETESGLMVAHRNGPPVEVSEDVGASLLAQGENSDAEGEHQRAWRKASAKESAKASASESHDEGAGSGDAS